MAKNVHSTYVLSMIERQRLTWEPSWKYQTLFCKVSTWKETKTWLQWCMKKGFQAGSIPLY